ncbi:hypothetical protein BD413DRAFT_647076 [Trametes elegans]|nr:hypothetical protein BD413DRAFT_647076 [Trametes elegans]
MLFILAPGAIASVVFDLVWHIFQAYLTKSPVDNLLGPRSSSFLLGNIAGFVGLKIWTWWKYQVEAYGPVLKLNGVLGVRILQMFDPRALREMMAQDADIYVKNPYPYSEIRLSRGTGAVSAESAQHRRQRDLLVPTFSSPTCVI